MTNDEIEAKIKNLLDVLLPKGFLVRHPFFILGNLNLKLLEVPLE